MASSRPDLEALLQDGNIIRIRPQGYSMYPLFIPGRDEALIESVSADTVRKNARRTLCPHASKLAVDAYVIFFCWIAA